VLAGLDVDGANLDRAEIALLGGELAVDEEKARALLAQSIQGSASGTVPLGWRAAMSAGATGRSSATPRSGWRAG
jgi:hypothetical protein